MLKQYETVFIMTPVLSDEQMKEAVSKFRDYLKNKGAEIVYEDNWGLRKMAYPIQKKSTGFYHLVEFKADPAIIRDFDIELKRDERVIRFLTMSLDKHAIAYNEKRRREKDASAETEKVEEAETPKEEAPQEAAKQEVAKEKQAEQQPESKTESQTENK